MFLVARYYAPIVFVAPPASSYTYRPSLPLPSLSTVLGALIARLNELKTKEGLVKGSKIEKTVAYKRIEELSNHNFSLGIAPVEGLVYSVQRKGIVRRISRYLRKGEVSAFDALAHEYSSVYAFDIAIGIDDDYDKIGLIREALLSITRIGDSESLVSLVEIKEVKEADTSEALGVIPAELVDNLSKVIIYRGSIFPSYTSYSKPKKEGFKEKLLKIYHLAFSLAPDIRIKALVPLRLKIKENYLGKEVVVVRPESPIALLNYSALKPKKSRKARR